MDERALDDRSAASRIPALRRLCYATMIGCTALDAALWSVSDLDPLQNEALRTAALLTLFLGVIVAGLGWAIPRVEPHITMPWLARALPLARGGFELVMFYRWLPCAITTAGYLVLPFSLPYADPWLAASEAVIGLAHPRTHDWFVHTGQLGTLARIYGSIDLQLWLMVGFFLLVKRDLTRMWEYTAVVAVAGVASVGMLWAFPAEGPWAHYGPGAYLDPPPSPPYLEVLRGLREGRLIDLENPHGFLNFPSFHTVFALLIAWTLRGNGVISAIAWALNLAVVISVVPIGWHYLVDVVGGVIWTVVSVVLVERYVSRRARQYT